MLLNDFTVSAGDQLKDFTSRITGVGHAQIILLYFWLHAFLTSLIICSNRPDVWQQSSHRIEEHQLQRHAFRYILVSLAPSNLGRVWLWIFRCSQNKISTSTSRFSYERAAAHTHHIVYMSFHQSSSAASHNDFLCIDPHYNKYEGACSSYIGERTLLTFVLNQYKTTYYAYMIWWYDISS